MDAQAPFSGDTSRTLSAEGIFEQAQPRSLVDKAAWHELFDQAVVDAQEIGSPVTVVFMDINFMKTVNDEDGHQAGDELIADIRGLVERVTGSLRTTSKKPDKNPSDYVAVKETPVVPKRAGIREEHENIDAQGGHVGGDEFAIMARTDEKGAQKIVARLRNLFDVYIQQPGNERLLDMGVGLAIGASTLRPDMTASELLKEADERMYEDKLEQLPELSEHQLKALDVARFILEKSGLRLRDVPKYFRLYPED